jgi:nicotinamidase-related amidase
MLRVGTGMQNHAFFYNRAIMTKLHSPAQALLIIDVQVGLVALMPPAVQDAVLPRVTTLLARARASKTPIIYIQHDGGPGHPLEPGASGWPIHSQVQPAADDLIIRKRESDSFFETTLRQELESRNITHLVVAGAMTEYCVDTTCRRATSLGYDVTLAGDAHLTRDSAVLSATQIIAHHNLLLDDFGAGGHVIRVQPAAQIALISPNAKPPSHL